MAKLLQRFLSNVEKTVGCWWWRGVVKPNGYGSAWDVETHKKWQSHRLSWQLHVGPIPAGKMVLHRCDQRSCVRPDHLFIGTAKDNMQDMAAKGRQVFQQRPEKAPAGDRHRTKTRPACTPHGTAFRSSKLTDAAVLEVRRRAANGEAGAAIARSFGVSKGLIYHVLSGRAWKHTGAAS